MLRTHIFGTISSSSSPSPSPFHCSLHRPPSFHPFRRPTPRHRHSRLCSTDSVFQNASSASSFSSTPRPFFAQNDDAHYVHTLFQLMQFIILHDPTIDIRQLEPIGGDILSEVFPQFLTLCTSHGLDLDTLPIILALKVEQFLFIITLGDDLFDLFEQTGYLCDFSHLPIQHSSAKPLVLWAFRQPI